MNIKLTVYLTVVLAIAIAAVVFVMNPRNKRMARERIEEKKVFAADIGPVTGLEIQNARGSVVLKQSTPGTWTITSPVHARADVSAVNAIVDGIKSLTYQKEIGKGGLSAYGLSPASITATVTSSARQVYKLEIGGAAPVGSSYYATAGNGHAGVFTLAGWMRNRLDEDLFQLRDKNLLAVPRSSIASITFTRDARTVYTIRKHDGQWVFEKPAYNRVRPSSMDDMLFKLTGLAATTIIDDPSGLKNTGLEKPAAVISIVLMDNGRDSILIGRNAGKNSIYARVAGQKPVYVVRKDAFSPFTGAMKNMIDDRLLAQRSWDVSSIIVAGEGKRAVFSKKNGRDWYKNGSRFTGTAFIDGFLGKLLSLRAAKFVREPGLFRKTAVTFTVTGTTQPTSTTVLLGNKSGNSVYAKTSLDPRLAVLPAADVRALESSLGRIY